MYDLPESHPANQQMAFAKKAVEQRELYYQGQRESVEVDGPIEGVVKWSETNKARQLVAANKWHMQQSEMFGSLAQTRMLQAILVESRLQTEILRQLYYKEGGSRMELEGKLRQAGLL